VIRTLAWKEFREHAGVWVALAALAAVVLAGLTAYLTPAGSTPTNPDEAMVFVLAAVGLAITYGLVCGAMMLAGEAEGGTLAFLDTLPVARRHLWAGKFLMGVLLTLLQGLLLGAVAAALGLRGGVAWGPSEMPPALRWEWLAVLPAVALEAYCWGLLGSALCRQVLPAVVLAALLLLIPWLLITPLFWQAPALGLVARVALAAGALALSALRFTRPDRQRRTLGRGRARAAAVPLRSRPTGMTVLLWLTLRQGGVWLLLFPAAGFLFALVLAGFGPVFWPVLTLLVGVACGSTVYLGEQSQGTYRFLGEQRLPLTRLWLGKTGFWLAVAVGVAVLVFVGGVVHVALAGGHGRDSSADGGAWALVTDGVRWPRLLSPLSVFGLWLLYGFSIAQTCGLVWRKSAAALFMSLVLSAAAGVAWLPSLLAGGLPAWQVFVPPALLLAANRLILRPWVSDRLYTWKPLAGLALCGVLAAAWVAAALGYRAVGVADLEEPAEQGAFARSVRAFEDRLPRPEQNQAASLIRQALAGLRDEETRVSPAPAGGGMMAPGPVAPQPDAGPADVDFPHLVDAVLQHGWTGPNSDLDQWLDGLFAGEWAAKLREAAVTPPGMLDDPRQADWFRMPDLPERCRWAARLFTARALQLQARGDGRAGLGHLAVALALSRHVRHLGTSSHLAAGVAAETVALEGLDRWVERVGPRPELLRQALAELTRHEQALPAGSDAVLADYVSCRGTLRDPGRLLRVYNGDESSLPRRLNGAMLLAAWEAPWEEARADRLVSAVFAGRLRAAEAGYPLLEAQRHAPAAPERSVGPDALGDWRAAGTGAEAARARASLAGLIDASWLGDVLHRPTSVPLLEAVSLCRVRGRRLVLALALYEVRKHQPAPDLDALRKDTDLGEVPADPFGPTQHRFGYRVSQGEDIVWDAPGEQGREVRHVAAGRGIVWSIGPDLEDNGGHVQGRAVPLPGRRFAAPAADWIFVVPRWP
jgi:hypothetical protein